MEGWEYDKKCLDDFSLLKGKVDHYFVDDDVPCPYKKPYTARFHQAMFGPLHDRVMELFLAAGYRRNGNSLYNMRCGECSACVSIRLHADDFVPDRNQRRTWKKNRDLVVSCTPIKLDKERFDLCELFLNSRYPQKKNTAWGYYTGFFLNDITSTYEIQYRLQDRLVGVGIIDLGSGWMNAVYFYFDVNHSRRSLGTYNILTMLDICRQRNLKYLYLGYTIDSLSGMCYKERFFPHYLLKDGEWVRVGKK